MDIIKRGDRYVYDTSTLKRGDWVFWDTMFSGSLKAVVHSVQRNELVAGWVEATIEITSRTNPTYKRGEMITTSATWLRPRERNQRH